MIGAQRFNITGRLDTQLVPADHGQAAWQRHDLIPALGGLGRIHVEDCDDAVLAIRTGRGCVYAARPAGPEIEITAISDHKLVPLCVVIAQEILAATGVAIVQHDIPVANGPEVRASAVIANDAVAIIFKEGVHILPFSQIQGAMQELGAYAFTTRPIGQRACGQGVVYPVLLPDTGIEDVVGQVRGMRNHGLACDLFPVQQQRIAGYGHHAPHRSAVVHGNDPSLLNHGRSGETGPLRIGIDGIGQIAPVNQVITDHVPPVLTWILGRVALVKHMPASLPEAEPVRIIQAVFRADKMIKRMVGIF